MDALLPMLPVIHCVTTSSREMSPNATEFDTFQLDNAVVGLTDSINLNGGFIVKGWYKPSVNEGAVQDLRNVHFCCLQPVDPLNVLQSARRYSFLRALPHYL